MVVCVLVALVHKPYYCLASLLILVIIIKLCYYFPIGAKQLAIGLPMQNENLARAAEHLISLFHKRS